MLEIVELTRRVRRGRRDYEAGRQLEVVARVRGLLHARDADGNALTLDPAHVRTVRAAVPEAPRPRPSVAGLLAAGLVSRGSALARKAS